MKDLNVGSLTGSMNLINVKSFHHFKNLKPNVGSIARMERAATVQTAILCIEYRVKSVNFSQLRDQTAEPSVTLKGKKI